MMRFLKSCVFFLVALFSTAQFAICAAETDDLSIMAQPDNVREYAFQLYVEPNWIGSSGAFWYLRETAEGRVYALVEPQKKSLRPLFDHAALASALSEYADRELDKTQLKLEKLTIAENFKTLGFVFGGKRFEFELEGASLSAAQQGEQHAQGASGDGAWRVFTRDHNLFVERVSDGRVTRLTDDGTALSPYATPVVNPRHILEGSYRPDAADVSWSWDNSHFVTYQLELEGVSRFSMDGPDGEIAYHYPLSMDERVPMAKPVVFEAKSGKRIDIDIAPLPVLYYGAPGFHWVDDDEIMFVAVERGYKQRTAYNYDLSSRELRTIIHETSDTFVNIYEGTHWRIYDWDRLLWVSDIGGHTHLYLADMDGGEKVRQLTKGAWRVVRPVDIVEARDEIYFTASGRREGVDPYYRALYRIKRFGGEPELLTPDAADHSVYMSPNGDYFVDNISEVHRPTRSVLRRSRDGAVVMELGGADISRLEAAGYTPPERFKATLSSGLEIYGVLYRPAQFDESASYPVIEHVYTGPHTYNAAISFTRGLTGSHAQSVANAGFIVVQIDAEGTEGRSRAFLHHAYKNLAEVGLDSRIEVIKALAEAYPQMDISRVGAFGFSAGGYDVVRMLTRRPDFYRAGAASSGNYDSRWDKAVWNEQWLGVDDMNVYVENSMVASANRLTGWLLLSHGMQDENVPAASTKEMVAAFKRADKIDRVEVHYYPEGGHFLENDSVYLKRRIDFFRRHLK